ncbi:helix-turn-helix domain-containing protein [Pseudomonas rhodesiae]|uniref:helix-turn-helix domain-containing protein n=1 Tax=Pseudomonas rhodesiae TaxID=76760 RepID=UPI0005905318|nr:helix-turn-helix transcriptional regulator [Pseudomonas rhodesiae]
MAYLGALGQVIREVRVAAGLSREGCAHVLNRDHLAKVEQGRQAISVPKLNSLCKCLGISQSLLLMAVEARLAGIDLKAYRHQQEHELAQLIEAGLLRNVANHRAIRGVRGKRADDNRSAIQALQVAGLAKTEVVRKLGVSRSTVDRYWLKQ